MKCTVEKKSEIISDEKHLLDITSSEVKPGQAGLVLGWVTCTFKQNLYFKSNLFLASTILFH